MKTVTVGADATESAVALLRAGEVVALPTETVYGLAADALNEQAVVKIFAAKDRPRFDPLIVHLPSADWVEQVAAIPDSTRSQFTNLTKRFWPGPLTFVVPRKPIVRDIVTAGLETVAVRISAHPVFSGIVGDFGSPLAAPSANRFGRISPTCAADVEAELGGLIPLIVDGGPTTYGLESTIIALRHDRVQVLRRGPVTVEQLAEFGEVVISAGSKVEAPGQLPSHYAPATPLILVNDASEFALPAGQRCGLLAWAAATSDRFAEIRWLSQKRDLAEAARNLFRYLRGLDGLGLDLIVAETVPDKGLGAAINDRLRRAAQR